MALQALHPLRLEEVLGLQWGDIDFENMTLHIERAVAHPTRNMPEVKATKTKSSVRIIGLSQLAVPYLQAGDADTFVLGGNRQRIQWGEFANKLHDLKRRKHWYKRV